MSLANSLKDMDELPAPVIEELVNSLSNKDALLRQTGLRAMEVLGDRVLLPQPRVMAALLQINCGIMNYDKCE